MEEEERNGRPSNATVNRLAAVLLLVLSMIVARSECRKSGISTAVLVITVIQGMGDENHVVETGI